MRFKTISIYFFISILLIAFIYFEVKLSVDKEIIAISFTSIIGFLGYFLTHYLENERKTKEEKTRLYSELVTGIRAFIKAGENRELAAKFEETYYASWLFVSTKVYIALTEYLNQYKIWADEKNDENKNMLNDKLVILMQFIRNETTVDEEVKFINYDIRIN